MSRTADVTSGIQKKYLTIDSAHFRKSLTDAWKDPYLSIQLPEPLHHVHEVALQMAVIPNEFFNIREENNRLDIGWINESDSASGVVQLTIPVGLYTLDLLITAINTQITNAAASFPESKAPVFARVASDKATDTYLTTFSQPVAITTASNQAYMFVIHPAYTTETASSGGGSFRNSIAHRLGFVRDSVLVLHEEPNIYGTMPISTWPGSNPAIHNRPPHINTNELFAMAYVSTKLVIRSFNGNTAYIKTSALSGTETYDALYVHCDLLSNSTLSTGHAITGTYPTPVTVHRTDVLATVPVNANIGSTIRYMRPSEHFFGHAINNHRPITHFKIWLTDDSGIPFHTNEMPDWLAVIEFTIVENVPDIVKQVHEINQNKAFQSRHMPMHLV